MTTMRVEKHATKPWFAKCFFAFGETKLRERLKQYPGVKWDANEKCWLVPVEILELLQKGAKK